MLFRSDIAGAVIRLLTMPAMELELPINLGSGVDYSIKELAEAIARVIGYQGRIGWDTSKPDGAPRKLLDSGRMRSTGWVPSITLEDGLQDTYRWYMNTLAVAKS